MLDIVNVLLRYVLRFWKSVLDSSA